MKDFPPLQAADLPALRTWRTQALTTILRAFMLLALPPILVRVDSMLRSGYPVAVAIDLALYLCFGALTFAPWPSHQWRVTIYLSTALAFSAYTMGTRGAASTGWIIIIASVVTAALLLGRRAAILTWLGSAAVTAVGIIWFVRGPLAFGPPPVTGPAALANLLSRAGMTLGLSGLLAGLIVALLARLGASLRETEQALAERDALNRSLEERVAERTRALEEAVAALHASEAKYKVLFQTLPTGVSIADGEGRLIEANPAAERLLGVSITAHHERNIDAEAWRILRTDGTPMPPDEYASVRALRERRAVEDVEMGVVRPGGEVTWINVSAAPVDLPGYGVAIAYSDISARRRADDARAASEAHLRALRDALPDLLFVMRADGTFLEYHAPRLEKLWLPPDQFLGRRVAEILPPHVAEPAMAALRKVLATGELELFEYNLPDLDVIRTFEARVVHIAGDDLLVVIRDISERQRVTTALLQAKEAAETADRAKSTFLAHVSHEIRTPLTAIVGMASLLREADLPPGQRESAAVIHTGAETLLNIIGNILDFSKIEAGQIELVAQPFDLHACCRSALDLIGFEARAKGLSLTCSVGEGVPVYVVGDASRIRQVLLNLLGNAVKFTDAGAIALRAEGRPLDADRVEVSLVIADEGIGIAPASLPSIFNPFVQADSASTRRYGGTGLGLAISKQLVELMGGRIDVVSARGQGSTFTVTLPLAVAPSDRADAQRPSVASPAPAAPAGLPRRRLRLLMAEDNLVNQEVLGRLVDALGYSCDIVGTGAEAVATVARRPYDVVLMDIQMPELDGEEATRRIRALTNIAQPYIIALTASTVAGDRERYLAAGMDAYLSKPVTVDDLREALELPAARSGSAPLPARPGVDARRQLPLIDWQMLDQLLASLGMTPERAAAMVLDLFQRQIAHQLEQLMAAAADMQLVRKHAHKLRGGSRQIGAVALAECCAELEAAALSQDNPACADLLVWAQALYEATLALLTERLSASP